MIISVFSPSKSPLFSAMRHHSTFWGSACFFRCSQSSHSQHAFCSLRFFLLLLTLRLHESDAIPKRIDDFHFSLVGRDACCDAGFHVSVLLRVELFLKAGDATDFDADVHTWTAVAVVLAEMYDEVSSRYLPVQWKVGSESMVPVFGEAEEVLVEFSRFLNIEDS